MGGKAKKNGESRKLIENLGYAGSLLSLAFFALFWGALQMLHYVERKC